MRWFKGLGFWCLAAALVLGCTKKPKNNSPEATLEHYVTTAFAMNSLDDKKKLEELSTGEAKVYLEKMPADEFRKRFIDAKLSLVSFKAKDQRNEESGDVSLVYELSYKDTQAPNATVYTNKKIAYLTTVDGVWKIKATKDIKSFVERKEDLVITPESTGK